MTQTTPGADNSASPAKTLTLVVRRTIAASAQRLFDAWTQSAQFTQWWGPQNVVCPEASIDLRVNGRYRIANQLPDGRVVWICGEFLRIERPLELSYTWFVEPVTRPAELVTVRFRALGDSTEVVVTHERIADQPTYADHEAGWYGCLEGLQEYVAIDAAQ
jgi:uncharacterized protein YndB with AHSA1/START domain